MESRRVCTAVAWAAVLLCVAVAGVLALAVVPAARAASGDLAWQRIYDGTGQGSDQFTAMARAPHGGVYVAGTTFVASDDFVVARYDAAGRRMWLHTFDGSAGLRDAVLGAAADSKGNLVVVGYANSPTDTVAAVTKYGPGGKRRWVRIYDDPASLEEAGQAVALDAAGNVYVAGFTKSVVAGLDIVLIKYSASGARRWVRHYDDPVHGADSPAGVAVDAHGNIYIVGVSAGLPTGVDIVTLKYDAAGKRRWVRSWDGPAGGDDLGNALAVTGAGTVYVAGQTTGISTGVDAVVLKYGSGGALKWSRSRTSPGASGDDYAGIALLGNGDVVAAGLYGNLATNGDALVTRLSPAGHTRWARTYNGPDNMGDEGLHVSGASNGAVYVSGASVGAATSGDILTLKYSGTGHLRWARRHTSSGNDSDFAQALLVNGGVYVAGYESSTNPTDGTLLKYRP